MSLPIQCDQCGALLQPADFAQDRLHLEDAYAAGLRFPPVGTAKLAVDFCSPECLVRWAAARWPVLAEPGRRVLAGVG